MKSVVTFGTSLSARRMTGVGLLRRFTHALLVIGLCGCSFIGGRVPDRLPAPARCPLGVIVADGIGIGAVAVPATAIAIDLSDPDRRGSQGDIALFYVWIPTLAVLGVTYVASTVYGIQSRRRCLRLQQAEAAGR